MRVFLVLALLGFQNAYCGGLTRDIVFSCLTGQALTRSIKMAEIPSHEMFSSENYGRYYVGTYLLPFRGEQVGYVENKNGRDEDAALVYMNRLYALKAAKSVLRPTIPPPDFVPFVANWLIVTAGAEKYFCASFNLNGIGKSGSFQNIRAAYMLQYNPPPHARLLFAIADIRGYRAKDGAKFVAP